MAGRYRVKPRFFIILGLVGLMASGILCLTLGVFGPPTVQWGSLSSSQAVRILLVRDETVVMAGDYAAGMVAIAQEGDTVRQLDPLLDLQTASWNPRDTVALSQAERQIRDIQENDIRKDTVDPALDTLDLQIAAQREKLNTCLLKGDILSAYVAKNELNELLSQRIAYLRGAVPANETLQNLYDTAEELGRKLYGAATHLASPRGGVVSYDCDGLENLLTPDALETITVAEAEAYLAGGGSNLSTVNGNGQITPETALCRVVDTGEWYGCMVQPVSETAPEVGVVYEFILDGCEHTQLGEVTAVREENRKRLVVLRFVGEIGNLLRLRRVDGAVGTHNKGYIVPKRALWTQDGQTMLTLNLNGTRTAVPVTVLISDSKQAMVEEAPGVAPSLANGAEIIMP